VAGDPGGSASSGGSAGTVSVLTPFGSGFGSAGAVVGPGVPGLSFLPPPGVELTPLAGISFGQAPNIWPLFLLLDVMAAFGVVVAVRKSWAAQPPED
jgi:hypothetical protein